MDITALTAEQVDEMEAGPGIDALIAIHVLGWVQEPGDPPFWNVPDREYPYDTADWPPSFSTDIAAAWELVRRHKYYFWMHHSNDNDWLRKPSMLWTAGFAAPEKYKAQAETPELVLCRAALKAALFAALAEKNNPLTYDKDTAGD
jgi:hypothetical protein